MVKKTHWLMPVSTAAPPVAPVAPVIPPQGGSIDPLSMIIMTLNYNPYIIGLFMIFLNLGGRFLGNLLTKKQDAFLQSRIIGPIIFFALIFIATRNLAAAFWVTLIFFFIIWVAANENSKYCIIPYWCEQEKEIEKGAEKYIKNIEKLKGTDNPPMIHSD